MRVLTPDAVHPPTLREGSVDGRQVSTIHAHDLSTIPSTTTLDPTPVDLAHNVAAGVYGHGPNTLSKARALGAPLLIRVVYRLGFAIRLQARREFASPNRFGPFGSTDWSFVFHLLPSSHRFE
jgi:hypothetical protein